MQVVDAGDVFIQSKDTIEDISRTQESNSFLDHISKSLPSYFSDDLLLGIQLNELYNQFEVGLTGFQVRQCAWFIVPFFGHSIFI